MCLSANVSFMVGLPLIACGVFGAVIAKRYDKRYLLLAIQPLLFGIQQFTEGQVWLSLQAAHEASAILFAHIYLFFAFFVWPCIVPLSLYMIEVEPQRKNLQKWIAFAGFVLGLVLFFPLLSKLVPVSVTSMHHSVRYQTYQSIYFIYPFSILYALAVIIPMFVSSYRLINLLGIISILAFIASYWWLMYAFTSLWCFAQAIISAGIVYILYQVKKSHTTVISC